MDRGLIYELGGNRELIYCKFDNWEFNTTGSLVGSGYVRTMGFFFCSWVMVENIAKWEDGRLELTQLLNLLAVCIAAACCSTVEHVAMKFTWRLQG